MKKQSFNSLLFRSMFLLVTIKCFLLTPGLSQGPLMPLPTTGIIEPSSCSQQSCSIQTEGYPSPYIYPFECSIGIERYLSRAFEMNFLSDYKFNITVSPTSEYCQLIESLADLNAQLIKNVYSPGYRHEFEFFPGNPWYAHGYQMVKDINHAYDCAEKKRPIIQASIFEGVVAQNFAIAENADDNIDRHIPKPLIVKFFSQNYYQDELGDPDVYGGTVESYYFDSNGNPKDLFFKADRIVDLSQVNLDITKIEAKMWFFYLATTVIDFGYRAIHMGLYTSYASQDPGYENLSKLTNAFRRYAHDQGAFVLLSGEPPYTDGSPTVGNTNNLIFDFDSRAMRPREISDPQVYGDGNYCNGPIDPSALSLFNDPESDCFGTQLPAVIDPCTIASAGGSGGGVPPALDGSGPDTTCTYEQVPYVIHFDGFSGVDIPNADIASPPQIPPFPAETNVSSLTWGYDDHRWFGTKLTPECQAAWFKHFYCAVRENLDGHGYMVIPGIINVELNELPGDPFDRVLIYNNPLLMDAVQEILDNPKLPEIKLIEHCVYKNECSSWCEDEYAGFGWTWLIGKPYYEIKVDNQDCASVYSIHIKDPDGFWLQQEIGDYYLLYPEKSGTYQIGVRQDNLALPPGSWGTIEVWEPHNIYSDSCCIEKIPHNGECSMFIVDGPPCPEEDNEKYIYRFSVSPANTNVLIQNIRAFSERCQIDSLDYESSGEVGGVAYIFDKENPKLEFLIDYQQNGSHEALIQEDIEACSGTSARSTGKTTQNKGYQSSSMTLLPNPANNIIQINLLSRKTNAIGLYDATGKLIFIDRTPVCQEDRSVVYDISRFTAGTYFVVSETDEGRMYGKFVKVGY